MKVCKYGCVYIFMEHEKICVLIQIDYINLIFLVAAENGYTSTLIRLMQLWPASSSAFIAVNKTGRNMLHLAAAENKKR